MNLISRAARRSNSSAWAERWQAFVASPRSPLIMLGVVSAFSLLMRSAWISNPRRLVFDEHYYVNAARKILGVRLPVDAIYANAASGLDPNFSHPPLGKVLIALGIRTFGDVPLGWRFASLVFGVYAVLALYWLARAAGMSPWISLGASALMAADPMFFIHGRIGTLEVFVLVFMLVAVAVYLGGRPALAGAVVGVGACIKLVCLFLVPCFVALELFRWISAGKGRSRSRAPAAGRRRVPRRLGAVAVAALSALVCYLGLLTVLDRRFTNYDSPIHHTWAMLTAVSVGNLDDSVIERIMPPEADADAQRIAAVGAAAQLPPEGPVIRQQGQRLTLAPTASPVEWLLNQEQLVYYRAPTFRGEVRSWSMLGRRTSDAVVFNVLVNPAVIVLAVPALAFCFVRIWRRRDGTAMVPAAWFTGVFGMFLLADAMRPENSGHLYYMVVVMPAIYLAVAQLLTVDRLRRFLPLYGLAVVAFALFYFPFKTWGGV